MAHLAAHQHGKSRVRVARVWRDGPTHTFVEWSVDTVLESQMAHAFLEGSNSDMTATDTQKNTVYYIAKTLRPNAAPEDFAVALARHFVLTYPKVTKAKVTVSQAPWQRHSQAGQAHDHAFEMLASGTRTAYAEHDDAGITVVHGGISDWRVLKTTQSGYEGAPPTTTAQSAARAPFLTHAEPRAGFCKDEYTALKDTRERMLATSVTATWKYSGQLPCYHKPFEAVRIAMAAAFFGPPHEGVYSPSVQYTLFEMGKAAVAAVAAVESVKLKMPNIHFLPCSPLNSESFADDVYVATSEPHGTIDAIVTRAGAMPHSRL